MCHFIVEQARLLYEHYRTLYQSERWRSLLEGAKPLCLVWDCTDIPPGEPRLRTPTYPVVKNSTKKGKQRLKTSA